MRVSVVILVGLVLGSLAWLAGCDVIFDDGDSDYVCPGDRLPPRNQHRVTIGQGIWGDVWFWDGDFMPPCPSGSVTAVSREIRIHELTSLDQVVVHPELHPAFYTEVVSSLIATTWSDSDGFFEAELDAGMYSVFAIEDSLYFANGSDGYGNIWPIEVVDGEVSETLFHIDYLKTW